MTGDRRHRVRRAHHHGMLGIAALLATLGLVGACTWMPDAANPAEWYKDAKTWVTGDKEEKATEEARKTAKPIPGADKPFPKLSSVPERPSAESRQQAAEERKEAASALLADRDRARYTDEGLGQGAVSTPPAPARVTPPEPVTPRTAPRPPAIASAPPRPAPAAPVIRAPEPPPVAPVARAPVSPPAEAPPPRTPPVQRESQQITSLSFGAPPADIAASIDGGGPSSALPVRPGSPASAPSLRIRNAGLGGSPVATVRFPAGSSRLNAAGRREIRSAYQAYRARGGILRVVGHASSWTRDLDLVSHEMANFNVSLDRANAVARELIRLGARPESIVIDAASDSQPVFLEVMPSGEAGNRRAEIFLER